MAAVIFSGLVLADELRVVDMGAGHTPRILVEIQQPADAMGARGWSPFDPIPRATLEAILMQSGIVT